MSCDELRYVDVEEAQWSCARKAVHDKYGIEIAEESGERSTNGFTLKWAYDLAGSTLVIQCTESPFLVPCGMINDRIQAIADECGITRG